MKRILICEDDPMTRNLIAMMVKSLGQIEEASDGMELLEKYSGSVAQDQPFDLVILDLTMPGVDGITGLVKLREIEAKRQVPADQRVKVLILSGQRAKKAEALEKGADAFLEKPLEAKVFRETIADLILTS